jgi:hypothetical protein
MLFLQYKFANSAISSTPVRMALGLPRHGR